MNIHRIYSVFQSFFRRRRMVEFARMFEIDEKTRILDVGGGRFNWTFIDRKPKITVLNIYQQPQDHEGFDYVKGDGRSLEFPDSSFDIVYSNSVIEHVGRWEDQIKFAREISRVGRRYYVQTPNRWFFIEPHLVAPLIHFLPSKWIKRLARSFTLWGLITKPSAEEVDKFIDGIVLLDEHQMRRLFPDAAIRKERFLGMTKSLIAVRTN